MSEETQPKPKLKAGEPIIEKCPVCRAGFAEPVSTNVKHTCPNPDCQVSFNLMVFEQ